MPTAATGGTGNAPGGGGGWEGVGVLVLSWGDGGEEVTLGWRPGERLENFLLDDSSGRCRCK